MNIAAIFAGGIGSRMSSASLPKQFLEIHGTPLIVHTIQHFQDHPEIDRIAVSILPEWRDRFARLVARYELTKVNWIVDGGATGQESRHRALRAIANECPSDSVVLLHDGVRPLINAHLISENIRTVREHGPAITTTKFNETAISSSDGLVDEVYPRDNLYVAQAPQSARLDVAMDVYDRAVAEGENDSIDTCSLLRRYGHALYRVDGPRSNIKITTAEDYYICRAFFDVIEHRQIGG
ncbi:2-C-methyl-D-erythritol 4-phosphate cytidylyltransferase [Microbacterium phyllosphaerae]|uniref:2-C-methyl-D-erythritol 4-phosphate cytidylyltransferase n=1 Tax=Microbacterium phyllosphaerae TaxID=124798 RepID=A0ABS4WKS1_9MICO|nr:IspD/TarI family cytidylyltransferase [Microbacterium phyllosphaerae]MBP2376728.1 2-C-methyl-D-erythritol 4-phosphate cytidylyltransferase [Microbacterium phyllosphaerae]MCS3443275.1 2-C-methyl-D-erythritol 4-phosphate cytidylyltransferase [Microbacterium phyllosphaerae]